MRGGTEKERPYGPGAGRTRTSVYVRVFGCERAQRSQFRKFSIMVRFEWNIFNCALIKNKPSAQSIPTSFYRVHWELKVKRC